MKKTLRWKIICQSEVYKFSLGHFLTRFIFYVLILKIENEKFHLLTKICKLLETQRNVHRKSSASVMMRMCSLKLIEP